MDNSIKAQTKIPWLTEGLLIAAIPIIAYLLRYCYELGFSFAFGIPSEFITIDLPDVLLLSAYLIIIGAAIVVFIGISIPLLRSKNIIWRSIIKSFFWTIILSPWILFSLLSDDKVGLVIAVVMFLVGQYGLFISPLLTQRRRIGYAAKLEAAEFKLKGLMNFLDYIFGWKLKHLIIVVYLLAMSIATIKQVGESLAIRQVEFLVTKSSPEMVVLRVYDDQLICAPFDRTTKEVKRTFSILKIAEDPNLKLSLEKIGPLHVEKEPTDVSGKSVVVPTDSLEGLKKK